MHKTVKQDRK